MHQNIPVNSLNARLSIFLILIFNLAVQTIAQNNTHYGFDSGNGGSNNSNFGVWAGGDAAASSTYNTSIGRGAGSGLTVGSYNFFGGARAGTGNTSGNNNVYVGYHSGGLNSAGSHNVFLGYGTGYNSIGSYNVLQVTESERTKPAPTNSTSIIPPPQVH